MKRLKTGDSEGFETVSLSRSRIGISTAHAISLGNAHDLGDPTRFRAMSLLPLVRVPWLDLIRAFVAVGRRMSITLGCRGPVPHAAGREPSDQGARRSPGNAPLRSWLSGHPLHTGRAGTLCGRRLHADGIAGSAGRPGAAARSRPSLDGRARGSDTMTAGKPLANRLPVLLICCAGIDHGALDGDPHVQGLFMLPLLGEHGWGREVFSFALGLQTLVWGIAQPVTGYIADKYGTRHVILFGCFAYAAGLVTEALAPSSNALTLGAGVAIGVGLTATTFAVVYGALSRLVEGRAQGTVQGLAGAIGGIVQFMLVPVVQAGIGSIGWSDTLQILPLSFCSHPWPPGCSTTAPQAARTPSTGIGRTSARCPPSRQRCGTPGSGCSTSAS